MRHLARTALLALSGLGLLHVSLFTDDYLRYVKEGMRPLLVASGAVLLLLAAAEAWSVRGEAHRGGDTHGGDHTHADGDAPGGDDTYGDGEAHRGGHEGHDHSALPRIAWLLLLPALSLLFYAPPALGAYTASREDARKVTRQDAFDPLPATSPLPITLTDFTERVQQDRRRAIKGRTVLMTGFVTPVKGGGSWDLTRIILSCCAADAQSVKIRVHGLPAPAADTWVSVTGTWHPGGTLGTASAPAALDARTVKKVPKPVNGYQDALPIGTAP
ncbi:TIGR03943 family protein [Streptomyces sp. NPDC047000]|uniref:TIGR03943 family putative permease subunit n=1 Tax=Streptomyces sp. NPDC047000 TaxID=3155474 RepID=UPI0033E9E0D0